MPAKTAERTAATVTNRAQPAQLARPMKATAAPRVKTRPSLIPGAPPVALEVHTDVTLKTCPKCGVQKPLEAFASDKSNKKDGRYYMCRDCEKVARDAKKAAAAQPAPAPAKATTKEAKKRGSK